MNDEKEQSDVKDILNIGKLADYFLTLSIK